LRGKYWEAEIQEAQEIREIQAIHKGRHTGGRNTKRRKQEGRQGFQSPQRGLTKAETQGVTDHWDIHKSGKESELLWFLASGDEGARQHSGSIRPWIRGRL